MTLSVSHVLKKLIALNTSTRIQNFLDALPYNHETGGETCMSPKRVLETKRAHCLEGALLAASALYVQGARPLLMHLKVANGDDHHAVALFKKNGYWGAISKTNHAVLGYRDPVYNTLRELALSYFHEYFLYKNGEKTLRAYSRPFSLLLYEGWIMSEHDLWHLADALTDSPHTALVPKDNRCLLRKATVFERKVLDVSRWKKNHS